MARKAINAVPKGIMNDKIMKSKTETGNHLHGRKLPVQNMIITNETCSLKMNVHYFVFMFVIIDVQTGLFYCTRFWFSDTG